jgi:hypothetical protein
MENNDINTQNIRLEISDNNDQNNNIGFDT